jgi:hypothetical protein
LEISSSVTHSLVQKRADLHTAMSNANGRDYRSTSRVLENGDPRLLPRLEARAIGRLLGQAGEERLHGRVIVTIGRSTHAYLDAKTHRAKPDNDHWETQSLDQNDARARWADAAAQRPCVRPVRRVAHPSVAAIAQPTTMRENRSRITARYSQPSAVSTALVSVTHLLLGSAATNSLPRRLGAKRARGSLMPCRLARSLAPGRQAQLLHQPHHAFAGAMHPASFEHRMNARTPVDLTVLQEDLLDLG